MFASGFSLETGVNVVTRFRGGCRMEGKRKGGREGGETDQMDLERMKNWFCQPNEPSAFLTPSLRPASE